MGLNVAILPVVIKDLPISPGFTPYEFYTQIQESYNLSTNGWIFTSSKIELTTFAQAGVQFTYYL